MQPKKQQQHRPLIAKPATINLLEEAAHKMGISKEELIKKLNSISQ